jgi:RHS repeat-associated protein
MRRIFIAIIYICTGSLGLLAQTAPTGNDNIGGTFAPVGTYGANPGVPLVGLNPYTANATRVVDDLSVASISEVGLNFTRYANSRASANWSEEYMWTSLVPDGPLNLLGEGGGWRHSFQWDFYLTSSTTVSVTYPSGISNTFTYSSVTNTWTAPSPVTDVVTQDASGNFYLTNSGNVRYKFSSPTTDSTDTTYTRYSLVSITDSKGLVTTISLTSISYGVRSLSVIYVPSTITEPGGRYITLAYSYIQIPYTSYYIPYITSVTSSDGRSVTFGYSLVNNFIPLLASVSYSGTVSATYSYGQQTQYGSYYLSQAIDSRAEGIPNIKYTYFSGSSVPVGEVQTVTEGSSNTLICTLSLQNSNVQTPEVTFPDNSFFKYTFAAGGLLTGVTNTQNNTRSYSYTSGSGTWTTTATDANGHVTTTTATSTGHLLSTTLPPTGTETTGPTQHYYYNTAGYLTSFVDYLGRTTTFTRNPTTNLVTGVSYPDGTTEAYTYNSFNEILSHTQRNGGIEYFTYNSTGLLLTHQDATQSSSHLTTYAYNSNYRLGTVTDANGHATTLQYNDAGQITTVTNPDSTTRTYAYQANMTVSVTNELGYVTSTVYDGFNRPLTVTDPLSRVTTYTYSSTEPTNPKPTQVALPSGKINKATYTPAWDYETASTTVAYGTGDAATTSYGYDAVGNVITVTDPRNNTTLIAYDARNCKAGAQDPAGNVSAFYYDDNDNLTASTTPDGNTLNSYDTMNRLTQSTDPKGNVANMTYDNGGSLATYIDPNSNTYSYSYDLDERQISMQYPDSSTESYTYDPVGNLLTYTTRAGKVQTLTYDSRNRSTGYSWNDGVTPSVTEAYDNGSRLTSASNSNSALSYTYDHDNELLTEAQTVTGLSAKTATYAYNVDGTLNTLTYPDGTVLTYGYNNRNQVTSVEQGSTNIVTYTYDAAGNPITKNLANGVTSTLTYDDVERLTSIVDLTPVPTAGTQLQSFNYGYDGMSRRKYVKRNGALGDVYAYDTSGQLVNVQYNATNPDTTPTSPQQTVAYTLDSAGNRTQVVDSVNGTTNYTPNASNQYTTVGSASLAYDVKGNLNSDNGWTYTYDAGNRLVEAQDGAYTVSFAYDPMGRCVERNDGGTITYMVYDTGWGLMADYNSTGSLAFRYVNGLGTNEILTKTDSSNNVIYYHFDGLGSVTKLTSSTGALLEQYSYDVFGNATIMNPAGTVIFASAYNNRFLFTGAEYIASMDLYLNRQRVYSARLGRFLQTDPAGHSGDGYNLYRYCNNDPVNNVDTFGMGPSPTFGLPGSYSTIIVGSQGTSSQGVATNSQSWASEGSSASGSYYTYGSYIQNANGWSYTSGGMQVTYGGAISLGDGITYGGSPSIFSWSSSYSGTYSSPASSSGIGAFGGFGGGGGGGGYVGAVQAGLNVAGLIPGIGEFANAASLGLSLYQGDYTGAAMSGIAMIPVVGAIAVVAKFGRVAKTVDELSAAAQVADRGGFTAAGRSLTKHGVGARPGNALFPAATGSPSAINQLAHDTVDDILTTPGTTFQNGFRGRFGNTLEVTAPNGRGLVYGPNGEFLFFKE